MSALDHARQPLIGWPVALLRISIGYLLLMPGLRKTGMGAEWAPRMTGWVERHLSEENTFAFFRPFLENVVLSAPGLFAFLVAWGELLVGLALILGALTRLSAFFGIVMMFSFIWAKGIAFWSASNYDALWVLMLATVMFCGAGRVLGVDYWLHARFGDKRWLW